MVLQGKKGKIDEITRALAKYCHRLLRLLCITGLMHQWMYRRRRVPHEKEVLIKYPNSANLFQFCRKVLDHKFGGIRVIDQDVGQILGFDPADCSHWKKGKKNIRSIQAMKSIATHKESTKSLL